MTKKQPTDEQRFLLRFEQAREEGPMSEREAREALGEIGVDPDAEFALLMQNIRAQDEAKRVQRLAEAETAYRERQARPRVPAPLRSRSENLAWVQAARHRHPEMSAHHHDLTHMSDDDLASLVEQLEELEADAEEG